MPSESPKNQVLRSMILVTVMACLVGIFLMLGVGKAAQRDYVEAGIAFALLPLLVLAGGLHMRLILKAVSRLKQ